MSCSVDWLTCCFSLSIIAITVKRRWFIARCRYSRFAKPAWKRVFLVVCLLCTRNLNSLVVWDFPCTIRVLGILSIGFELCNLHFVCNNLKGIYYYIAMLGSDPQVSTCERISGRKTQTGRIIELIRLKPADEGTRPSPFPQVHNFQLRTQTKVGTVHVRFRNSSEIENQW